MKTHKSNDRFFFPFYKNTYILAHPFYIFYLRNINTYHPVFGFHKQ